MSDDSLTVGMLGHRFMGRAHGNALARLPMFFPDAPAVERQTLIGRDEAALETAQSRLGFSTTATDWAAALDDIDVLYNLGPNHLHAEPAIAALEQNVHVLCEKPLATTLTEAQRMRDAAAESDAAAACAFNYRFVPAVALARQFITEGRLGTIRHVRGRYLQDWLADPSAPWSWRLDERLAGAGALGDLGTHTFDLVDFVAGDQIGRIEKLNGHTSRFVDERPADDGSRAVTVDDAYGATVEFESGAAGVFEASRVATGHKNDHTIEIHGTEGSLRFALERLNELKINHADSRGYETILVTDETDPYIEHWWPPGHVIGWEHTFVHENREFLSAITDDRPIASTNLATFEQGTDVQRVVQAVKASDERGESIDLTTSG